VYFGAAATRLVALISLDVNHQMGSTTMRTFLAVLIAPTIALAQPAFPTEWPSGAETLQPDALRQRLIGKSFVAKSVTGPDVRTEYQDTVAYINVGSTSDFGPWRTEGSAVCNEWKKLRPACSEMRVVGEVLYVKRANNGEVMALVPR
jgi:hypothetical protein